MKSPTRTSVRWLNAAQAAEHLGFPTVGAFHTWLCRERQKGTLPLTVHWLRGRMRFREVDLDRCIEAEPQSTSAPQTVLRVLTGGRS